MQVIASYCYPKGKGWGTGDTIKNHLYTDAAVCRPNGWGAAWRVRSLEALVSLYLSQLSSTYHSCCKIPLHLACECTHWSQWDHGCNQRGYSRFLHMPHCLARFFALVNQDSLQVPVDFLLYKCNTHHSVNICTRRIHLHNAIPLTLSSYN